MSSPLVRARIFKSTCSFHPLQHTKASRNTVYPNTRWIVTHCSGSSSRSSRSSIGFAPCSPSPSHKHNQQQHQSHRLLSSSTNGNNNSNNSNSEKLRISIDYNSQLLKNTISSYLSTLRMKTATTLTSSLLPSERQSVLKAVGAIEESEAEAKAEKIASVSIGEAVVKALAEERSYVKVGLLEKEREIERKATEAVTARLSNELRIQEQRLNEEKMDLERRLLSFEEEAVTTTEEERSVNNINDDEHAILGKAVVDLGYKRIHLVSGETLATIPVWEKQRTYRHDRAKIMASDKIKSKDIGLPGIISLHEEESGQLSILDGQHRVGMLAILQDKAKQNNHQSLFDTDRILVEVFPSNNNNNNAAAQIFTEINKAEPIKLVDMPGVAKSSDRNIINQAASSLKQKYPDMFKPSQKCRSPHLNIDNLRDVLFTAEILKKQDIQNHKDLIKWLMDVNDALTQRYNNEEEKVLKKSDDRLTMMSKFERNALDKARKYGFYLGLESSWLYQ